MVATAAQLLLDDFLPGSMMRDGMGVVSRPRPVPRGAAAGIASYFMTDFGGGGLLLEGMAQPLYPPTDLSAGIRAALVVTGSVATGGEALLATPVGLSVWPVLGSGEVGIVFTCDLAPWLGSGEVLQGALPTVTAISAAGKVTTVTAALVAGLSLTDTSIALALGQANAVPGTTYRITFLVTSSRQVIRQVQFPHIKCLA